MAGASLAAENAVLGSIVEDLQLQITQQREGAGEIAELQSTLRQTEDALLDMHDECKTVRASHAQAAEALKVAQRSLGEERKARIVVQQQLRHAGSVQAVTERTMAEEVALLEREWLRETDSGFATQLREAAEDAVKGMHEAQAECRWLYEQLQTLLAGGTIAPAARAAAEHPRFPPPVPAGPAVATSGESAHSLDAMRGAYTKAVQRCHQLQVHAASADELDAPRRAELVAARERIAALQAELDVVRSQARRAAGSPAVGGSGAGAEGAPLARAPPLLEELAPDAITPPPLREISQRAAHAAAAASFATPAGGAKAAAGGRGVRLGASSASPPPSALAAAHSEAASLRSELGRARSQCAALERALESRQAEHQADLASLCAAQREAADTRRVLASERAWVAALDEMRLDDLRTIQQLERKLQAWQQRFEPPSQSG